MNSEMQHLKAENIRLVAEIRELRQAGKGFHDMVVGLLKSIPEIAERVHSLVPLLNYYGNLFNPDTMGMQDHDSVELVLKIQRWEVLPVKSEFKRVYQKIVNGKLFQVDLPVSTELRDYGTALKRALKEIQDCTDYIILSEKEKAEAVATSLPSCHE